MILDHTSILHVRCATKYAQLYLSRLRTLRTKDKFHHYYLTSFLIISQQTLKLVFKKILLFTHNKLILHSYYIFIQVSKIHYIGGYNL